MNGTSLRPCLPNEAHLLPVEAVAVEAVYLLPVEADEPHLPLIVSNNQGRPIDLPSIVIHFRPGPIVHCPMVHRDGFVELPRTEIR